MGGEMGGMGAFHSDMAAIWELHTMPVDWKEKERRGIIEGEI